MLPPCSPPQLRQLDAWYREETDRWANERDELCRRAAQLEQRHTQFQHELRRRDVEHERLQKHLAGQLQVAERRRAGAAGAGAGGISIGSGSTSSSSHAPARAAR